MGIDEGFDLYPPLTDSDVDKVKWAAFLDEVKEKYKHDDNMTINLKWSEIAFTQGEHPSLALDGHRFRRFSSKISGSHSGNVTKYLNEIEIIAKRHFGERVHHWSDLDDDKWENIRYGWDEVYAAKKQDNTSIPQDLMKK